MKQNRFLTVTIVIALSLTACDQAVEPQFGVNNNGNGFPSGGHYNLNIIGVRNNKQADLEANSEQGIGRRIFVSLYYQDDTDGTCFDGACPVDMRVTERSNKIILEAGTDYGVMDANATDRNGARFRLPANVSSQWYAYARPLGKPGDHQDVWARMTTCGTVLTDPDPTIPGDEYEEVVCSLNSYMAFRDKGRSLATDVTSQLFYVDVTLDAAATDTLSTCLLAEGFTAGTANVPLFDSCFETVFWDYDNHGLKLLQLRFYPRQVS
jgi:hypothetical protein